MKLKDLIQYCKDNNISENSVIALPGNPNFEANGFNYHQGEIQKNGDILDFGEDEKRDNIQNCIVFTNKRPEHRIK